METYEYGIPPIYADSEVLDFDALQNQTAEPGSHYPARAKPGQTLAAGFFQPQPAEVPPDLSEHAAGLMGPVAQFLTGAFPALFGGAMSNNDTASWLRDGARAGDGKNWVGVAPDEIFPCGHHDASGGLLPEESAARR